MAYIPITDGNIYNIDDFPSAVYSENPVYETTYEKEADLGLYYFVDAWQNPDADDDLTKSIESLNWYYKLSYIGMAAPEDTLYKYKINVKNLTTGVIQPEQDDGFGILTFTATANSIPDLVNSVITTNKLDDGAITADKIAAGTITADQIAATNLLASGASVGMLNAEGIKLENAGFWATKQLDYEYNDPNNGSLTTYTAEAGEFFVGNNPADVITDEEDKSNTDASQYIHYYPKNSVRHPALADSFAIRVRNFIIKSIGSFLSGIFSVKSNISDSDTNAFFVVNPTSYNSEAGTMYDFDCNAKEVRIGTVKDKNATLTVNGKEQLSGTLSVGGALTVTGTSTLNDNTTIKKDLTVTGATKANGTLSVGGALTVTGTSTLNDNTTIKKDLTVEGKITSTSFKGNLDGNASSASYCSGYSEYTKIIGSTNNGVFKWTGQSGQPTWLWGSNDGINQFVWNPSNFSVKSATAATTATTANHVPTGKPDNNNGAIWVG